MARQGVAAPPEQVATALAARELGMSQPAAAALAGVSHQSVDRYEKGQSPQALEPVTEALVQSEKLGIARDFIAMTKAGQKQALARIGELDAYRATIVAGIATDKLLALTTGPSGGTGEANALDELVDRPGGREVIGELLVNMSRALADLAARPQQQAETVDAEAVSLRLEGEVGVGESEGMGRYGGEGAEGGRTNRGVAVEPAKGSCEAT